MAGYWEMTPEERQSYGLATGGALPAYAQGPGGEPVPFDVQGGFEAQAAQPPGQLTAEEVAEFRALREEKKRRDAEAAAEAEAAAARLQDHTHHVLLAGGEWVKGSTIATHYDNGDGQLVPVVSVHEINPVLIG
jgi:hypothetical protein